MRKSLMRHALTTVVRADIEDEIDTIATWENPDELATEDVAPALLEREIKFAVSGLEVIERRLKALEGSRSRFIDVTRERNCVLDTDGDELKSRDERLRLREIAGQPGVKVTWKGPASERNGVRRREEREFHADDRSACLAVFRNL